MFKLLHEYTNNNYIHASIDFLQTKIFIQQIIPISMSAEKNLIENCPVFYFLKDMFVACI